MKSNLFVSILILSISSFVFAQGPPRGGGGRPPQGPPKGQPRFPDDQMPRPDDVRRGQEDDRGRRGKHSDWLKQIDQNKNGNIERGEYQIAADAFFRKQDKNGNGTFEKSEQPIIDRDNAPEDDIPAFLFLRKDQVNLTKTDFDISVNEKFKSVDRNADGIIDREEMKQFQPGAGFPNEMRNPPPNATFIGAEMRFGDKWVKDAPFSAETIMENTRRLFDGTTITKENKGAFYRDSQGRTRREQPLDFIGSYGVVGENKQAPSLVFISDYAEGNQYFIDNSQKIARKNRIENNRPPIDEINKRGGKTESLGTKTLEGVNVEGTRITFEIPIGEIGNERPILVVTEKWYSPELQMIVMSKHVDPLAGEQTFRLVNIKRSEPAAELFQIPAGYRIENPPKRQKRDE
jgi:hypothetical protein